MPIKALGNDGFVATGKSVDYYRLVALRGRLRMEILGIRFRGTPTAEILRREFGWSSRSRVAILSRLEDYIESVKEEWNK